MRLRCVFAALALAVFLSACAGTAIRPVGRAGPADVGPLDAALDRYNGPPLVVRALGKATFPGSGRADFAARAVPGKGFRLDAVAGPFAKLLFSSACREAGECEIYVPDQGLLIRQPDGVVAGWLGSILSGRVPRVGAGVEAWRDDTGANALRLVGNGSWQVVVFDSDAVRPKRVLYGDDGGGAELEIEYLEFRPEGDTWYPFKFRLRGAQADEELTIELERVERGSEPGALDFTVKVPAGTRIEQGEGSATWKSLGLFWMPKR